MKTFCCLPLSEEARTFQTPLRGSDMGYLVVIDVPVALCWPETQLDGKRLKDALERTLDLFPVVAARIRYVQGRLTFTCVNSKGVLFQVDHKDHDMPNELSHISEWEPYFPPMNKSFRQLHEPINERLWGARLTLFKDKGCVLCVNFAHVLSDGAAILQFLKAWSYYCNLDEAATEPQPPTPVLSRLLKPEELIPNTARKNDKEPSKKGKSVWTSPAGNIFTLRAGMKIIAGYHRLDECADFVMSAESLQELKHHLSGKLDKPKWISSYEAIMTCLLKALAIADGKKRMTCRAIVNIRGRSPLAPKDYFGNALSFHAFTFDCDGDISDSALQFHESLRSGLTDVETLNSPHVVAERYATKNRLRSRWVLNRAGFARPFLQAALNGEPIVNSWMGFDWFGMTFGGNMGPGYLKVSETFRHHRHIHVFPSNPIGEITIRMNLRRSTMSRFREALKEVSLGESLREIVKADVGS